MSAHPTPAPAPNAGHDAEQQATADARYYRAVLHELISMGTDIARTVHSQATAQAQAAPGMTPSVGRISEAPCATTAPGPVFTPAPPDLAAAFDRIARCVRRTVLLAQRVAEPPKAAAAKPGMDRTAPDRTQARTRILRAVEDTIDRRAFAARTPFNTDKLHRELHERLDRSELDHDLLTRPVDDIIAEIVRDLGISWEPPGVCPSRRRTPADIAALHARAASPIGSAPPPPLFFPAPPRRPQPARTAGQVPATRLPGTDTDTGTDPGTAPAPAASTAPAQAPTLVPIPDDPPPGLAAMLALATELARNG